MFLGMEFRFGLVVLLFFDIGFNEEICVYGKKYNMWLIVKIKFNEKMWWLVNICRK